MSNYRDKLVAQIKDAGQELIDRAETMAPEGATLVTGFEISIKFDQGHLPCAQIQYTTTVASKREIDALRRRFNQAGQDLA